MTEQTPIEMSAERYCVHIRKFDLVVRVRMAHLAVIVKSSPARSRAELDETMYLCAICAGYLVQHMITLELTGPNL